MTHDENFKPTTKQTCAQVTQGQNKKTNKKQNQQRGEEMIVLQQSHNVNSMNGKTTECDMHEVQMQLFPT